MGTGLSSVKIVGKILNTPIEVEFGSRDSFCILSLRMGMGACGLQSFPFLMMTK